MLCPCGAGMANIQQQSGTAAQLAMVTGKVRSWLGLQSSAALNAVVAAVLTTAPGRAVCS